MRIDDLFFIFEIANNHQGSVEHGARIIDAAAEIARAHGIRAAVKFQFRDLDTLVHPDYRARADVPHIPRFLSTRLDDGQFRDLIAHARACGLGVVATPFDEPSVQACVERGVDIIKVASCSAADWPLLEAVASAGLPVIASTGGLEQPDIDRLERFLAHRGADFAILHCVATYPAVHVNLGAIARLIRRYPGVTIGYSGHESPANTDVVRLAVALGARILERHIGVEAGGVTLNSYSVNPAQAEAWVRAAIEARRLCADGERDTAEAASLRTLQRGVYAAKKIGKGAVVRRQDVFFAMPLQHGQITAGEFGAYRAAYRAGRNYQPGEALCEPRAVRSEVDELRDVVHDIRGMLAAAGVASGASAVELSHHYGLARFRETGAAIVTVINEAAYCKKLVIVLPNQRHPAHYHKRKQETFQLLSGDLILTLNGVRIALQPGDCVTVRRGDWHEFESAGGAIVEEVSTHHYTGDSVYRDAEIAALDPVQRKTVVEF